MRPTRFRWFLATLMFLVALTVYMDRVNLSVATPYIMQEFGFTKMDMGYLQTAFFLGYALMQVPGGILSEMFSHRKVIPLAVTWWSFFTAATAWCGGFTSFILVRFLFGCGEGPAYPGFVSFVSRWFSKDEKAKANSFHLAGSFLGPVFGPGITVALMLAFGWRWVFIIFGIVGIVVALLWYIFSTNTPRTNRWVNDAEKDIIESGISGITDKGEVAPWSRFFRSSQFWAIGIQYFIADYIMFVFLAWLPLYLMEAQGFSLQKMGMAASFPWMAIACIAILTGLISDKLVKSGVRKYKARTYFGVGGLALCSIALYMAATATSPTMNVLWLTVSLGALGFTFNATWTACADIGGKFAASVAGWTNLCGNLGGVLAPTLTAWLASNYGWQTAILATSGAAVIGILAWLAVKPDIMLPQDKIQPQITTTHSGII